MNRPTRTVLSAAASAVLAAGLGLASTVPAHAVDTLAPCTAYADTGGLSVCAGIQTTGGDVRGFARAEAPRGKRVSVVRTQLQRRPCGGSWTTWTTRTAPEDGGATDSLATTWVVRPARYQFRTQARVIITDRGSGAAYSVTDLSRAFGAC